MICVLREGLYAINCKTSNQKGCRTGLMVQMGAQFCSFVVCLENVHSTLDKGVTAALGGILRSWHSLVYSSALKNATDCSEIQIKVQTTKFSHRQLHCTPAQMDTNQAPVLREFVDGSPAPPKNPHPCLLP